MEGFGPNRDARGVSHPSQPSGKSSDVAKGSNPWYKEPATGVSSSFGTLEDIEKASDKPQETPTATPPVAKTIEEVNPARETVMEQDEAVDSFPITIALSTVTESMSSCNDGSKRESSVTPSVSLAYARRLATSVCAMGGKMFQKKPWRNSVLPMSGDKKNIAAAIPRQSSFHVLERRSKSRDSPSPERGSGGMCQLETQGIVGRGLIMNGSPIDMVVGRIGQAVALLDVFAVPVILCFENEYGYIHSAEKDFSLVSVSLYCMVIILSLFTSYIDVYTGKMIADFTLIRQHVVRQLTFWGDLFTVLVQVAYLIDRSPFYKYTQLVKYWRCWRFICDSGHFMGGVLWSSVLVSLHEGLSIICYLLIMIHNLGCLWWKVGGGKLVDRGYATIESPYLHSVTETTLMMLGIAAPRSLEWDDPKQLVYVNIVFLTGSLCVACIYSQFVIIMQRLTMMESHTKSQLALVWSASNSLNIPQQLRIRITGFHRFKAFIKQHAHEELLAGLSRPLLLELKLFLLRHLIKSGAFFADLEPQIISELLLGFDEMCFSPGDLVIKKDDPSNAMYFIIRGVCKVMGDFDGPAVAHLVSGDFFGEMALLFPDSPRTAFVMCDSYCMLASLTVEVFQKVVEKENQAVRATVMRTLADFLRRRVPAHKSFEPGDAEGSTAPDNSNSTRSAGSAWKIKSKGWVGSVGNAVGSVFKDSLFFGGGKTERRSSDATGFEHSSSARDTVMPVGLRSPNLTTKTGKVGLRSHSICLCPAPVKVTAPRIQSTEERASSSTGQLGKSSASTAVPTTSSPSPSGGLGLLPAEEAAAWEADLLGAGRTPSQICVSSMHVNHPSFVLPAGTGINAGAPQSPGSAVGAVPIYIEGGASSSSAPAVITHPQPPSPSGVACETDILHGRTTSASVLCTSSMAVSHPSVLIDSDLISVASGARTSVGGHAQPQQPTSRSTLLIADCLPEPSEMDATSNRGGACSSPCGPPGIEPLDASTPSARRLSNIPSSGHKEVALRQSLTRHISMENYGNYK